MIEVAWQSPPGFDEPVFKRPQPRHLLLASVKGNRDLRRKVRVTLVLPFHRDQAGSSLPTRFFGTFRLPSTTSPPPATRFSPAERLINPVLANIEFQKLSTSALSFPYFQVISTFPSERHSVTWIGVSRLPSTDCCCCWSFNLRLAALDHVFPMIFRSSSSASGSGVLISILMDLRYVMTLSCSSEEPSGGFGSWCHVYVGGSREGLMSPERNLLCPLVWRYLRFRNLHQVIG